MKYLKNFKTKEEYDQFRGGAEYLTPNVSFVETTGSIINDSVQIECDCGSGGGDSYNIEYLDVYALDDSLTMSLVSFSFLLRWDDYTSSPESSGAAGAIYAIMIDLTTPINLGDGSLYSTKTILTDYYGVTEEQLAAIPRITREQFFDPDWMPLGYGEEPE